MEAERQGTDHGHDAGVTAEVAHGRREDRPAAETQKLLGRTAAHARADASSRDHRHDVTHRAAPRSQGAAG